MNDMTNTCMQLNALLLHRSVNDVLLEWFTSRTLLHFRISSRLRYDAYHVVLA